ncbi:hypothetical protein [Sphingomonas sp.]|uniref:hypothetical protein n=1 Tax=Sphingomonas sp. TaxID=28214 RepID=UPI0025EA3EF5|nr:hypothetical protein [Sphingomonas sp.]
MSDGAPQWDEAFGDRLLGAVILVGITRRTAEGDQQEQFFGTVEQADARGIELRLGGSRSGENYFLPPDSNNIFPAQLGSYKLRQTGEVVENPDYTATWTIYPPAH